MIEDLHCHSWGVCWQFRFWKIKKWIVWLNIDPLNVELPGMVHACNPSYGEAESGKLQVHSSEKLGEILSQILKNNKMKMAGDIAHWGHLLSMCKVLGSVPSTTKKESVSELVFKCYYIQMSICGQHLMVSELTHLIQLLKLGSVLAGFRDCGPTESSSLSTSSFILKLNLTFDTSIFINIGMFVLNFVQCNQRIKI